jgi:uncharacterized membrane protein
MNCENMEYENPEREDRVLPICPPAEASWRLTIAAAVALRVGTIALKFVGIVAEAQAPRASALRAISPKPLDRASASRVLAWARAVDGSVLASISHNARRASNS